MLAVDADRTTPRHSDVVVTFPDRSERRVPRGTTLLDLAAGLDPALAAQAVAGKVSGRVVDLKTPVWEDSRVEFLSFATPEGEEVYRHSSAHLLAQAVKALFPEAKLAVGPPIEHGFYYDIDLPRTLTPEDLARIEAKMAEIAAADYPIERAELPREEALALFRRLGEDYKVEIIEGVAAGDAISCYRQGEFVDLCRGPHLPSTGKIGAFKLLSIAGAYWRGDERNRMLQRIYGTSFPDAAALEAHLARLEEMKRRDHRRLGRELDLFSVQEEIGAGLILWHPKGAMVRKVIEDYWREEHLRRGYELVYSPHLARVDLWRTSGHTEFFRENMFAPMGVEGVDYQIKPMNCPFHIQIYRSKIRSYRDLPLRWAELGTVYRFERSGVLHGLMRVRGFTQDDAHIFCTPDQVEEEIRRALEFSFRVYRRFGFAEYDLYLSTRPEKAVGRLEDWERATRALEKGLKETGLPYRVDEGGGAFYGPKIDLKIKDCFGRPWQCGTIQFDFNLPERFGLSFVGEDGGRHYPFMIHRALMGSLERYFGILLEHYGGAFPLWLAPVQVVVSTITDRQVGYAEQVAARLRAGGIRAQADVRNEKIGLKIREATLAKVPYIAVVGDREVAQGSVALRTREGKDLGAIAAEAFLAQLQGETGREE
ncbi:MAG: threonine--tRNA ligase [Nitrospirae bacterium]|nr:threonine--tRNA ligase [Nitrospirota bacterium]